jgi:MFS family permease
MFRYWPGWVVVVALMMGACYSVITVFLTRFATEHGLRGIGTFFTGYAGAAFVVRIVTRRWSESVGRHRMIMIGLCGHWLGYWMLPFVTRDWHFVLPSICCGWGHALLFPAVVSRGSGAFPIRFRGSGTTAVLGFFDLGSALAAPILGGIIDYFDGVGFSQMFFVTGAASLGVAILYALTAARKPDVDYVEAHERSPAEPEETLAADEPEDEPVAAPFPHIGRMA